MQEKFHGWLPKIIMITVVLYVGLLGFATIDELFGWGIITPYFK